MTKKDYIAIAAAIRDGALINLDTLKDVEVNGQTRRQIAALCANVFARDNGRFDRDRFFAACGLEGGR